MSDTTPTPFRNDAAEFVYTRTYSRWIEELGRRETWEETVDRYVSWLETHRGDMVPKKVFRKIREAILNMEVMPSMRALWAAGEAADSNNVAVYNCSFQNIDNTRAFAECLFVLMSGTGYGFSVEEKYTSQLPVIADLAPTARNDHYHTVEDSREGWAESTRILMEGLWEGYDTQMDYSLVRPKGARLKKMGGRASGPEPLMQLHAFIREVFSAAQGRQLTPLECHDILNQIAEIVVVGGVRRSSQISLSDLDNEEMANAKIWPFPMRRAMSNNSATYTEKPTATRFLAEWSVLAGSGTGERGIFNLEGARKSAPKRRDSDLIMGTNPCAEISLRSKGFCNLSEVVMRHDDDLITLLEKVETATWIGAIQSTFTDFPYLSQEWIDNAQEERLLGVSLTGMLDNPEVLTADNLKAMKQKAVRVARHASKKLEINMPAAITCVKPSGTVSQLVDSASGIHPRYSKNYVRRYRIDATDPLRHMMYMQGFNMVPDNGMSKADWDKAVAGDHAACRLFDPSVHDENSEWSEDMVRVWVVEFPIEAPENSITRNEMTAIEQLELYKRVQQNWCEHNASNTVYVGEDEWFEVGAWVYKNWDSVNGVSFLPKFDHLYENAPYEEVTAKKLKELKASTPKIDYTALSAYETTDNTEGAKSFACVGDKCEIDTDQTEKTNGQ